ncbi:DUF4251 domain-containing protein [Carboxylicivirga taeanensis]|uniref:DUF4251 domain-containing protein n=1 Tax=Carboxylicivirga taeanensis TaxID=1416875 RepID=UPI003F6DF31F
MKQLILVIFALSLMNGAIAQETDKKHLSRKEMREIRKLEQKKQSEAMSKVIATSIEEKKWVLEANSLAGKRGSSIIVNSNLNFIAMEGDEAFVQLGSDTGMGANGVGGVSVRGRVTKYEVKKNEKKGTYFITLYVSSAIGSFDIRLDCNSDGQIANATVQGNTSGRIQYRGILVPLSQSTVYKGTPII